MIPSRLDPRRLGPVALALAAIYLIWGSTYLAIRYAIETLPTFALAGARFLIAGSVLYVWGRSRGGAAPTAREWRIAGILGALLFLCGNGLVMWSEHHIASGVAALLIAIEPLWVVCLAPFVIGSRPPSRRSIAGLVTGFAGVVLLVAGREGLGGAVDPWGALAVVVASGAWAYGSLLSLKVRQPASAAVSTATQMLAGGVWLSLVGVGAGEWLSTDWSAVSARSIGAFVYLTLLGSLVAFSAYTFLLRSATPTVVSTYAFVNPVVAVALGAWLAAEPVTPRVLGSSALILIAVATILFDPAEHAAAKKDSGEAPAAEEAAEAAIEAVESGPV